MFLSVGGCLGKFLLDFLAAAPIIALHCLYRVGALQKMLNTDDAISVFRSLRSQEKSTFIKSTVFILGNFIGTFVGTTVVVTIKLTHYKRSVNFKSRLAPHRFSQKTNRRICFVCFFFSSRQTNQICPFLFWENLRLSPLCLLILSYL